MGIIFGSFSEAVQEHPDLVRRYLGTVFPRQTISSRAQFGGVQRRLFLLRAQGRALPYGAFDLLSASTPRTRDSSDALP